MLREETGPAKAVVDLSDQLNGGINDGQRSRSDKLISGPK
jgi:hypothetical protein